ncbi:MAG: hypothetical protein H7281_06450 [Bacteriovorax sp.]|nr:hypothetical protein [Bacteriovorax sp.]
MKKLIFLVIFLHFNLNSAFAGLYKGEYSLGLFKDSIFNASKITHVIIVGSAAKEDSDQFFQAGVARAFRYKEVNPLDQVVIMSSPEVRRTEDAEVFNEFNIFVFKTVKDTFTGDKLMKELNELEKIASIDFFGHSSPWGLKLGKTDAAFDPTEFTQSLTKLKSKMLPNSYMTISSCNSGFYIAPEISRVLEIPVSGSLTSSVFERIESDGAWYKEDDWTKDNYVEVNNNSYNEDVSCALGLCWRMKASRFNYSSYWGQFKEGGLSFYKFFCNFENNSDGRCEKGMAKSLLTFPSVRPLTNKSTTEDFKAVAFDWICSTANDKTYFKNCVAGVASAIARGDLVFQTHPGNELICDFKSCKATVVCKKKIFGSGPRPGGCNLQTEVNNTPTTAAREMLSLLKGFNALKK